MYRLEEGGIYRGPWSLCEHDRSSSNANVVATERPTRAVAHRTTSHVCKWRAVKPASSWSRPLSAAAAAVVSDWDARRFGRTHHRRRSRKQSEQSVRTTKVTLDAGPFSGKTLPYCSCIYLTFVTSGWQNQRQTYIRCYFYNETTRKCRSVPFVRPNAALHM